MNVEMRPGGPVKIDPAMEICDLIEKGLGSDRRLPPRQAME
jgi:hypothetical protein